MKGRFAGQSSVRRGVNSTRLPSTNPCGVQIIITGAGRTLELIVCRLPTMPTTCDKIQRHAEALSRAYLLPLVVCLSLLSASKQRGDRVSVTLYRADQIRERTNPPVSAEDMTLTFHAHLPVWWTVL